MSRYYGSRRALLKPGNASTGVPTGVFNLALASPDSALWVQDVATNLQVAAVNYPGLTLNITQYSVLTTLPTINTGQFDAIFFWSDAAVAWNSSFDTFNNTNGGLVTAQCYPSTGVTGITATIMPTVNQSGGQNGGSITWPAGPYTTPIANGLNGTTQQVKSFVTPATGGLTAVSPVFNAGASAVVNSTSGTAYPFVVVKDNPSPIGRTVFLNFFPVSNKPNGYQYGWDPSVYPDAGLLMLNALLWAAKKL